MHLRETSKRNDGKVERRRNSELYGRNRKEGTGTRTIGIYLDAPPREEQVINGHVQRGRKKGRSIRRMRVVDRALSRRYIRRQDHERKTTGRYPGEDEGNP